MRTIAAAKLVDLVAAIMCAGGSSTAEAQTIAQRLVDSNLVGHDSHGVLRVGKYLEWVRMGWLRPNTSPTIVFESETIAIIDGNRGFGQVIGEFATKLGIAKAAESGVAMIGLRNCGHLGRLGDWAEMAAAAGQRVAALSQHVGRATRRPVRRLGPAPVDQPDGDRRSACGWPAGDPRHHDLHRRRGQADGRVEQRRARAGWVDHKHGKPTTDPKDFYDGGALLTIGAHKGSGLSMLTDLLAGAVTTGRSSDPADTVLRNNMLSIYIAPAAYDKSGAVAVEAKRLVDWVKASPQGIADDRVLAPGEVERRTRAARLANGVALDGHDVARPGRCGTVSPGSMPVASRQWSRETSVCAGGGRVAKTARAHRNHSAGTMRRIATLSLGVGLSMLAGVAKAQA